MTTETKQITSIEFQRPDDEVLEIYINGESVAYANHDEHGWAGIILVEEAFRSLARITGVTLVEP